MEVDLETSPERGSDKINMLKTSPVIQPGLTYFPVITLSTRYNQTQSKPLCKGYERFVYCNEYKTKKRIKTQSSTI